MKETKNLHTILLRAISSCYLHLNLLIPFPSFPFPSLPFPSPIFSLPPVILSLPFLFQMTCFSLLLLLISYFLASILSFCYISFIEFLFSFLESISKWSKKYVKKDNKHQHILTCVSDWSWSDVSLLAIRSVSCKVVNRKDIKDLYICIYMHIGAQV